MTTDTPQVRQCPACGGALGNDGTTWRAEPCDCGTAALEARVREGEEILEALGSHLARFSEGPPERLEAHLSSHHQQVITHYPAAQHYDCHAGAARAAVAALHDAKAALAAAQPERTTP